MRSSFRKPVAVLRHTGGYYDNDGYWHDGETSDIVILASVQPLDQQQQSHYTQMLGEGAFTSNMVSLFSDEPFLADKQGEQGLTQEADVIVWRGTRWKIIHCEAWQSDVINHFRSVAQEIEERTVSDNDEGNAESDS